MARPISDEELELKKRARRRLVGAIVVVVTAAVVLPMVLDSEPKPVSQNVSIAIPSPESGEFQPKSAPAAPAPAAETRPIRGLPPEPPPAKSESAVKGAPPAPAASAAETAPAPKSAAKSAPASASKEKAPPKDAVTADASATASGAYVVQIAALADAAKAKQLEQQVAGTGLKTYTEVINTQAGERTRVRVGPYATREAAESARGELKKAGLDGQVVPR